MRYLALAFATLFALSACSRVDPIGADLTALNAAGQAAMASADVQQAMAKVQTAKTPAEKATILRESSLAIGRAQADLLKVAMKSDEVRGIQGRMAAGFGKLGVGAKAAADAFETAMAADLEKARLQMREGQVEFLAAGQEMVRLAKLRSVDLMKKS
jgi:hypothetical protein